MFVTDEHKTDILHRRVLLALYWIALAIGSHWPRLQLFPPPDHEPIFQPDKGLHFVAFAGLAWLMIRAKVAGRSAGELRTAACAGVFAILYAGGDELAQHWAQRQVTFSDFLASAVGVLSVVLFATVQRGRLPYKPLVWAARWAWLASVAGVLALALPLSGMRLTQRLIGYFTPTWGGIDKPCHFIAAILATWLLASSFPAGMTRPRLGAVATILVMALSAPMIEMVQGYTGRGVETADVYAHELGMAAALAVWALISIGRALRSSGITERSE